MANPALRQRHLGPGDKLGKFELIRQIAVGGMAELYLARTMGIEGFEKLVVVKRILPQYADNQSFVNMFLNEARLSATLHHPNIAQVYDIGVEDGDYFFSMEYIHGEDLGHLVVTAAENGVPVSLDCSLTLGAGLCAGLHYAHEKAGPDGKPLNVVHRDVSPSNVLVSYDGAVKLVDFGIARTGSQPATTRGGLKGKIAYMSPEQCKGKVALDRRSDIFSVGSILYELTTGRLPFTDETEYGILNQIVNNDVPPPSTIVPDYPPALEAILMRALARDPEQRFATAIELQGQLEDFAHENRLRVSPLVLSRLMSSMFPQRLEEWDHARAQGAFFVEQHVVRTLIESGRTSEVGMTPPPERRPADDETTDVVAMRPIDTQVSVAPAPPTEDPTSPGVPITPDRPSPMPLPAPRPTPPPSQLQAAAARMTPGTLVSSSARDSAPYIEISHEPTEIVSVPPDNTTMVRAPRSKTLPIVLGLGIGGVGIAIALLAAGGGKKETSDTSAAAKPPSTETAPAKTEPPPATPPEPEPVAKEEPVPAKAEPPKPVEKKKPPAIAKQPPKRPTASPPVKKPETKKEPAWNAESPFMPVRTDKK